MRTGPFGSESEVIPAAIVGASSCCLLGCEKDARQGSSERASAEAAGGKSKGAPDARPPPRCFALDRVESKGVRVCLLRAYTRSVSRRRDLSSPCPRLRELPPSSPSPPHYNPGHRIDRAEGGDSQEMEEMSAPGGLCDDAVMEILVRLPSESVLRCRAVCKRWRRITTDRSFLAAHSARRPREMIVITPSPTLSAIPLPSFLDPADTAAAAAPGRRGGFLCDTAQRDKNGAIRFARLLYSLDGLIVFEESRCYVVCNPVTRQWTNLPALVPRPCFTAYPCGFYLHSSSGEYRLLCHGDESATPWVWTRPGPPCDFYYVLAAGGTEPRRLCRAPEGTPIIMGYETPVAHADVLYWFRMHPDSERTGKMLAFDTAAETFRLMARPPGVAKAALLELDGSLCAATIVQPQQAPGVAAASHLDVWVLQDHDTETWTLRHRMQLTLSPMSFTRHGTFPVSRAISAAAGDGSSSILIGHNTFHVVVLCDLKEKRVRGEFHCGSIPSFLVFRESLVSHAFFQLPCSSKLMSIKFPDTIAPTQEESTSTIR